LVQSRQGVACLVEVNLGYGQVVISLFEVRAEQNGFAEVLDCIWQLFLVQRDATQKIIGLRVGGVHANDGFELLNRELVVLTPQINVRQFGVDALADEGQVGQFLKQFQVQLSGPGRITEQVETVRQAQA